MLASLNHPNIAAMYGFEEAYKKDFLVKELVQRETVIDSLQRGALTLEDALNISKQIAEALEATHDKGIIHRDLKPANAKLSPEAKVKVLDFGLAKALTGGDEGSARPVVRRAAVTGSAKSTR